MLEQKDLDSLAAQLAPLLVAKVRESHHDFWIDAETHYLDHQRLQKLTDSEMYTLKNLIKMFKMTEGLFFKAFIGAAIIGGIILAGIGLAKGVIIK